MTYITPDAAREAAETLAEAENRVEELESQLAIEQSYIGDLTEEMTQLDKELVAERNKYDALARSYELCDAKLRRAQKAVRNSWRGSARKEWKEEHAVAIAEAFEAPP